MQTRGKRRPPAQLKAAFGGAPAKTTDIDTTACTHTCTHLPSHPKLVPELRVSDIDASSRFYVDKVGCTALYGRPGDGFVYLALPGGAELMLDSSASWATAETIPPFGRGVNLQIEVPDVRAVHRRLVEGLETGEGHRLFRPLEAVWYRRGDHEVGNLQFLVQDPDGYLLRFFSDLGERSNLNQLLHQKMVSKL